MMHGNDDNADQLEFLLGQYLDGDLDTAAAQDMERRLANDPALAAQLEQLRRIDGLVRDWAGPPPELDWDRFTAQAARRRAADQAWWRRSRRLRLYAPLSAAAVLVLAVTLYFTAGHRQTSDAPADGYVFVSVQRADAWRHAADLGKTVAQVSFSRTPPPDTPASSAALVHPASTAALAVAAAGVGPLVSEPRYEDATPYF